MKFDDNKQLSANFGVDCNLITRHYDRRSAENSQFVLGMKKDSYGMTVCMIA